MSSACRDNGEEKEGFIGGANCEKLWDVGGAGVLGTARGTKLAGDGGRKRTRPRDGILAAHMEVCVGGAVFLWPSGVVI